MLIIRKVSKDSKFLTITITSLITNYELLQDL